MASGHFGCKRHSSKLSPHSSVQTSWLCVRPTEDKEPNTSKGAPTQRSPSRGWARPRLRELCPPSALPLLGPSSWPCPRPAELCVQVRLAFWLSVFPLAKCEILGEVPRSRGLSVDYSGRGFFKPKPKLRLKQEQGTGCPRPPSVECVFSLSVACASPWQQTQSFQAKETIRRTQTSGA